MAWLCDIQGSSGFLDTSSNALNPFVDDHLIACGGLAPAADSLAVNIQDAAVTQNTGFPGNLAEPFFIGRTPAPVKPDLVDEVFPVLVL